MLQPIDVPKVNNIINMLKDWLGRATDAFVGILVGGTVWLVLNFVLFWIPILGWIIAALVGGYVAGRMGGGWAAVLLALLAPLATGIIGGFILSTLPFGGFLLQSVLGFALGVIIAIWAVINLIFVGIGGAVGSNSYTGGKDLAKPKLTAVSTSIQQHITKPITPELLQYYPAYKCPNCEAVLPVNALLAPAIFTHHVCGKEITISTKTVEDARQAAEERLKKKEDREFPLKEDVEKVLSRLRELDDYQLSEFENRIKSDLHNLSQVKSNFSEEIVNRKKEKLENALLETVLENSRRRPDSKSKT